MIGLPHQAVRSSAVRDGMLVPRLSVDRPTAPIYIIQDPCSLPFSFFPSSWNGKSSRTAYVMPRLSACTASKATPLHPHLLIENTLTNLGQVHFSNDGLLFDVPSFSLFISIPLSQRFIAYKLTLIRSPYSTYEMPFES